MPATIGADEISTKALLEATGISEATLRRWLKDGQPIPELLDCRRDWRQWRIWEPRHIEAIRSYQKQKEKLFADMTVKRSAKKINRKAKNRR